MSGELLLSTAYLPPVCYFSLISGADSVLIEKEENYIKQSYRNRCRILGSNGILTLSVPVKKGTELKVKSKDIEIDYSKRWQQVHLRAIISSYKSSAYFDFYFEAIESIILKNHRFLMDLNSETLDLLLKLINLKTKIEYTTEFRSINNGPSDYRYKISPKTEPHINEFSGKEYFQLFLSSTGFVSNLSILDLLFNAGPDTISHLK
jgi:hypothetical protein